MSLLQYLSQRLLLLGLVVSAGIFYIVYILYQWGLDDSTEYYLAQDMQWAVEMLANNQALPSNTQFRQFYLTDANLADAFLSSGSLIENLRKTLLRTREYHKHYRKSMHHFWSIKMSVNSFI